MPVIQVNICTVQTKISASPNLPNIGTGPEAVVLASKINSSTKKAMNILMPAR